MSFARAASAALVGVAAVAAVWIAARTGVSQVPPGPAEAGGLPEVVFDNFAFTQLGAGPGGERRVRVDFRINVPLTAESESYIFTAPLGANFEAGGVAGFPGFSVQVIRVFGTGDETPVESDAQMYIRKASGGLGAGAHAVSITVNFPACNSWLVNFAAELYQSGPGSTLIGMGSTTQFVPATCDECAGAVLSVAPLGADPPEVHLEMGFIQTNQTPRQRTVYTTPRVKRRWSGEGLDLRLDITTTPAPRSVRPRCDTSNRNGSADEPEYFKPGGRFSEALVFDAPIANDVANDKTAFPWVDF
jgi:hypothetical protein